MKKLIILAVCAGCATQPSYPPVHLVGNDWKPPTSALGVGGTLFASNDFFELVSTDDTVVRIGDRSVEVIGVQPGTASVLALDSDGDVRAEMPVSVAPVTELRLIGFSPVVAARTSMPVVLEAWVGEARSAGAHYYEVLLDGAAYYCWGDSPRYCNGPVYYDELHIDGLAPGNHEIAFHPIDGGADFTFQIIAR